MIYKAPTSIKNQGAQKASTLLQKINTIAVTLRPRASIGQLMTAPKRASSSVIWEILTHLKIDNMPFVSFVFRINETNPPTRPTSYTTYPSM